MTYIDLFSASPSQNPLPTNLPPTVLALGNFDGVHIGHQALLTEAVRRAAQFSEKDGCTAPGVWLFRTPPSDFLGNPPIPHLSTLEEKLAEFRKYGIRYVFLGDFEVLGSLSPEAFVLDVLQNSCRCRHAICGFNYTFGKRGAGTPKLLRSLLGDCVTDISPVTSSDGQPVSSTRIRSLLSDGNVREAAHLLGRPYSITRPVLHGKALGRTIDFPTVNQSFPPLAVIPKSGIYAVTVHFPWKSEKAVQYGIANIGVRPTVENAGQVNCETYILDFSEDLYGKTVEIRLIERLRDERKMSGIAELKQTIAKDEAAARRLFGLPQKTDGGV